MMFKTYHELHHKVLNIIQNANKIGGDLTKEKIMHNLSGFLENNWYFNPEQRNFQYVVYIHYFEKYVDLRFCYVLGLLKYLHMSVYDECLWAIAAMSKYNIPTPVMNIIFIKYL